MGWPITPTSPVITMPDGYQIGLCVVNVMGMYGLGVTYRAKAGDEWLGGLVDPHIPEEILGDKDKWTAWLISAKPKVDKFAAQMHHLAPVLAAGDVPKTFEELSAYLDQHAAWAIQDGVAIIGGK